MQVLHSITTFGNYLIREENNFGNFNEVCVSVWCGGIIDITYYSVEVGGALYTGGTTALFGWHVCRTDDLKIHSADLTAIYGFQTTNSNGGTCAFTGIKY